jgi:hypothetical protein
VIKRLSILLLFTTTVWAQELPNGALKYAPVLKEEIVSKWPTLQDKSALAGQVEQETCISLKHSKCWNPKAELKTSREHGIGLGQITITYDKDGKVKVDNVADVRKLDKDLAGWKDEGVWDPRLQLRGLVVYDRHIYTHLPASISDEHEKLAFALASYNGGLGGSLNDRRLCSNTPGCDPNRWFGNVEQTSFKSKIKPPGYGKSFFEINREYPRNILLIRKQKYARLMG